MSQFFALKWNVKPESVEAVRELFAGYGRPDPIVKDADGNVKGRLVGTQVFMKDNTVVRVMEIEGSFPEVAAHLSREPAIRELESQLDAHLETPRDMSNPEGARAFFMSSMMECLVARRESD